MPHGLIIGGTGMLSGTVLGLCALGWELVLPSRSRRVSAPSRGGAYWVPASWEKPDELASVVSDKGPAPFDLLVAWVHTPYRDTVLTAVEPLLASGAPVVEVWGSASADPLATLPEPALGHPTHRAVLGYTRADGGGARWLSDREIGDGVLHAALAAVSGEPPRVHEVGTLRPWPP